MIKNEKRKNKNEKFKILAIETSCDETSVAVIEVTSWLQEGYNELRKVTKSYSQPIVTILSNVVSSQIKLHAKYGGVYPELASREHVRNIIPVIEEGLREVTKGYEKLQGVTKSYRRENATISNQSQPLVTLSNLIDYIAVTVGPGLIGSLLVGVETAKTLAYVLGKPIVEVNHLEGHIYANFIGEVTKSYERLQKVTKGYKKNDVTISNQSQPLVTNRNLPEFPILALIVSGGHTSLIYMKNHLDYKIIGETLDDAAGEAFDKVAAMLELSYPGGPAIEEVTKSYEGLRKVTKGYEKLQGVTKSYRRENATISNPLQPLVTNSNLVHFPRPMINSKNFDFSFSGLKTAVLYTLKKLPKPLSPKIKSLICHEFQDAVVDVLVTKTLRAAEKYQVKSILLGGGVAANSRLREEFESVFSVSSSSRKQSASTSGIQTEIDSRLRGNDKFRFFIPEKSLCTDNAAVIGVAAAYKILLKYNTCPFVALAKRDKILANKADEWYNVDANANLKLK